MSAIGKLAARGWPWLCTPLLLGIVAAALVLPACRQRPARVDPRLDSWTLETLIKYLDAQGLGLRPVASDQKGVHGRSVFLTRTDKEFEQLNFLVKHPEKIERWRGTVSCDHLDDLENI